MRQRLLGANLDLSHKSIHKGTITRDKVLEVILCVVESLPLALQDALHDNATSPNPSFGVFFAVVYHYLLLANKPVLSLPQHTRDSRSFLQTALDVSRSIIASEFTALSRVC